MTDFKINNKMLSTMQSLWQQGTLFLVPFSSSLFLIVVFSWGLVFIVKKLLFKATTSRKNPPPSPKRLPIIGNLHQLGLPLHHTLFSLSKKYGPLVLLHLGHTPLLVISSAEAAHEAIKTHDLAFSFRREFKIAKKLLYDGKDVAMAPYGEYWRRMKSLFSVHLLSNKRVRSSRVAREERTAKLMDKIEKSSLPVFNVTELLTSIMFDMVCEVAFGKTKEVGGVRGERFRKLLEKLMMILGEFVLGDFIPWLAWVSSVSGKNAQVDKLAKEIDDILEDVVQQHIDREAPKNFDDEDFVDILLKIQKDEGSSASFDRDGVKAMVLDAFAAGVDTTSTLLEWEMSEVLKNPTVMKRLQEEIRAIGKGKPIIKEEDLEKMKYLKAVVKETLRLHPPAPLPIPREAAHDVNFMGYDVAAKTMVMFNLWAINRDPKAWENPYKFQPERFINSSIDFKGNDFQFIPFGVGRRGCPGISFATMMNEIVLANLIYKFDWKLPNGMGAEDLDMTEGSDFIVRPKAQLFVIAIPHSFQ